MLMKSGINPFDSQEVMGSVFFLHSITSGVKCAFDHSILKAKPYKNDPEILAMTNLVR